MNVLILHFRSAPGADRSGSPLKTDPTDSAGADGVSLEIKKRQSLLESMGHTVSICSAYDWADLPVPALEFDRQQVSMMNRSLFGSAIDGSRDQRELESAFRQAVRELKKELQDGFGSLAPDMLFVHNVLALPVHPVATVALTELLSELRLPCVAIHHDILSEGAYKFQPTSDFARSLLATYFPPKLPNLVHWTINTRNQKALVSRGIAAKVIHDTMDFNHRLDPEAHDKLRSELRTKHRIAKSDVVLFVGARIAPNKQIEVAADLTAVLTNHRQDLIGKRLYNGELFNRDSRIVLALAGRPERAFADYQSALFAHLKKLKVDWMYVGDTVLPRRVAAEGYYALYPDMYAMADFILYPSNWEGFGNQLLEAFAAGLPTVVFEYPVFQEDIAPKGVRVISLGDTVTRETASGLARISEGTLEQAALKMIPLLADSKEREIVTAHNIEVGKRHFDFNVLQAHLAEGVEWAARRAGG